MKMANLERFFFSRYLKHPKRNLLRFSFVFMTLGLVLSVAILSAGLNLFEGYERSLKEVLLGSFAHLSIQKSNGEYLGPSETQALVEQISRQKQYRDIRPVLQYSVMATNGEKVRGASLSAYHFDAAYPFPYKRYISQGKSQLQAQEVIIGRYLARDLGKGINDTLKVVYPRLDRISAMGMFPAEYNFKIVGIYSSGFYENDRSLLICGVSDAQALLSLSPGYTKLEISLQPKWVESAGLMAAELQTKLGSQYTVYPWTLFSAGLLRLVKMEKWLIFIIFSFLVMIAGINVISAVSTIIIDKKNEIAVLKTLGASAFSIKRLLSIQVGLVALAAIMTGQLLGALLSYLIEKQSFYRLKGEVYFIDSIKTSISPLNQLIIFVVASLLVFVCIRYPLKQIDKQQIIQLLRSN